MKAISGSDITDIPSFEKEQSRNSPRELAPLVSVVPNTYRLVGTRRRRIQSRTPEARPSFRLRREHDGNERIVVDVRSGVFGHGQDDQEALRDFMRAARDHLAVLEQELDLPQALQAQREYLRARVRP